MITKTHRPMKKAKELSTVEFRARNDAILRSWFKKRFGKDPEDDPGYFQEWAHRLYSKGMEAFIAHMDGESRKDFVSVISEHI